VATIQANGGSSLLESLLRPQTDPLADDRMRYAVNAAKDEVARLGREYANLTGTVSEKGKFNPGPMVPPTQSERDRLKKTAKTEWNDGVSDMSDEDYAALGHKVAAWDAYTRALQRYEAAAGQATGATGPAAAPAASAQETPRPSGVSPYDRPDHSEGEAYAQDTTPNEYASMRDAVKQSGQAASTDQKVAMMTALKNAGLSKEQVAAILRNDGIIR
jgi:hypothetical protein